MKIVTGYRGEPHITAADDGALNMATYNSGNIVLGRGQKFAATIVDANHVRIDDGELMIQGRHCRIQDGLYETLQIGNGIIGQTRHDLIVARYEKNPTTDVESVTLMVLVGTSTSGTAVDPEYEDNDISELGGALITDFPLYRIVYDGLNVSEPEKLFNVISPSDHLLTEDEMVHLSDIIDGVIQGEEYIDLGITNDEAAALNALLNSF